LKRNRPSTEELGRRVVEYPVFEAQRSYEALTVECPVTTAAVAQVAIRE
jgi:hypothetical protein